MATLTFLEKAKPAHPRELKPGTARFRFVLFHFGLLVLCFSVLRLMLFMRFKPAGSLPVPDVSTIFLIGLHLDVFVALALTLPLLFWLAVVPNDWAARLWHRAWFRATWTLFWAVAIFVLLADYYFFEEFNSRFNT